MHVMFLLSLARGQKPERAAAQIHGIEMAGGTVFSINDGIMSGALVPVTVAGIDVKIVQLGEDGQFIGQGLLDVALMNLVEFLEQTQVPCRVRQRETGIAEAPRKGRQNEIAAEHCETRIGR